MNDSNVTQPYSNWTHCQHWEPDSDIERAIKMSALSIVGGFGLFGNVFTIVLAAKFTVRRNLHFLIMNMAVSDTLLIFCVLFIGTVRFYLVRMEMDLEIVAVLSCYVDFGMFLSQTVSLVTLIIISIERYRITRRRAVQIARPYSIKRRLCLLIGTWLFSAIISLNVIIFTTLGKNYGNCYVNNKFFLHYIAWHFIRMAIALAMFLILLLLVS